MYKNFFKRIIDFTLALIGLVVLSPLFIIVWIWLTIANRKSSGRLIAEPCRSPLAEPYQNTPAEFHRSMPAESYRSPALFFQERPGKDEKIFRIIKFRTMNNKRDVEGNLLPDKDRLTRAGAFVRKTSLDEIPQLINVLKGDMSLIGPRPLLVEYLPLYSNEHARRHEVRPGITGWAQVNGRNLLLLSKKFDHDVWYVNNLSFKLDMKIFFMTIMKIIKRSDVGEGAENMKDVDDLGFREKITNNPIVLDDKLKLRYPTKNDVDELLILKNNKEASRLLGGITPVYTKESIARWIEFHNNAKNEVLYVIHDCERNMLIGHVGLYNIDLNAKKAEFGILIADNDSHGKGYGSICLKYMIDYAFKALSLNKISLSYLSENKSAEYLYLKFGFKKEGVLKQEQYKNNQFYDVILMAKFNPNFQ